MLQKPYYLSTSLGHCQLRPTKEGCIKGAPGVNEIKKHQAFWKAHGIPEGEINTVDRTLTTGKSGIIYFAHKNPNLVRDGINKVLDMAAKDLIFEMT